MNLIFLFLTTFLSFTTAVSVPSCQFLAPNQTLLKDVKSSFLQLDSQPFGLVFSKQNSSIAFVGLNHTLGVLSIQRNKTNSSAELLHSITLPEAAYSRNPSIGAAGIALTKHGKYVLVTMFSSDLVIVDSEKAIAGDSDAVVTVLNGTASAGKSGIEVIVYEDFAFVSQEDGSNSTDFRGTIEVFNLKAGRAIGSISLGLSVVGTSLSKPDEKYLYATSEVGRNQTLKTIGTSPIYGPIPAAEGTLSTLDVSALIKNPAKSRISAVKAGCGAVRVQVSKDGDVAWVTARESNSLLAFEARKLVSNHPDEALLASVPVGQSPVGLVFVKNGTRIVTADSNRWELPESRSGLSVVDVEAALEGKGKEAVLGSVETGEFPREFALSPDGKVLLVSVFGSKQIQVVEVDSLP